ncbi:hypothetical protein ACFKCF_38855 [Nonomuraea sp. JJY05]
MTGRERVGVHVGEHHNLRCGSVPTVSKGSPRGGCICINITHAMTELEELLPTFGGWEGRRGSTPAAG